MCLSLWCARLFEKCTTTSNLKSFQSAQRFGMFDDAPNKHQVFGRGVLRESAQQHRRVWYAKAMLICLMACACRSHMGRNVAPLRNEVRVDANPAPVQSVITGTRCRISEERKFKPPSQTGSETRNGALETVSSKPCSCTGPALKLAGHRKQGDSYPQGTGPRIARSGWFRARVAHG